MRQNRLRPIAPRQTQTTTHAQGYNLRTGSQANYTAARRSDKARVISSSDARHFVGGDVDRTNTFRWSSTTGATEADTVSKPKARGL